jgi:hypothetical protein
MNKSELWADPKWCVKNWGQRRGSPWTKEEFEKAIIMRLSKHTDDEIAAELGRTVGSVTGKIGYLKKKP